MVTPDSLAFAQMSNWNASASIWQMSVGAFIGAVTFTWPNIPGAQHQVYISGHSLTPWSRSVFGTTPGPSLNISTYDQLQTLNNTTGETGYLCVWIHDPSSNQDIEYCGIKWRSQNVTNNIGVCSAGQMTCFADTQLVGIPAGFPAEYAAPLAQASCDFNIITVIGPGSQASTAIPGAVTTITKAAGPNRNFYGFQISRANLSTAIGWANAYLQQANLKGTTCSGTTTWQYFGSTDAAIDQYSIGTLENGAEGGPNVGWNNDSLLAWTSF
jgi:hypothetical protein